MDIKDLNKSQLLLLAVLLSFVTSIATGITTVTLMQQAPSSITTPVNRVIRQTIEKIEQVEGKTVTQTVVVKEEDLVVDAVAKNKSAVFAITKDGYDQNGNAAELSVGQGFAINNDGVIVVDAGLVTEDGGTYYIRNESGKFRTKFLFAGKGGFSFIQAASPLDAANKLTYTLPAFGDVSKVRVGQKLIVLGSSSISSFIFDGDKAIRINTTKANAGAMVFNLDAEVLGIALFSDVNPFASMEEVNASFAAGRS
jgi:hypothetical protein